MLTMSITGVKRPGADRYEVTEAGKGPGPLISQGFEARAAKRKYPLGLA